ncbi:MAG: hypothetical protein RLZZ226_482 [Pseudomonadota bacterium]|jgi:diguanylate cyclase (GGDEF)-like protein
MDTLKANRRNLLNHILDNGLLSVLFQPVIDFGQQKVMGYEASMHGREATLLRSREALQNAAVEFDRLTDLTRLYIRKVIEPFKTPELSGQIFLDLPLHALTQAGFGATDVQKILKSQGISPDRIIVSPNDADSLPTLKDLTGLLQPYRDVGCKIGVDDRPGEMSGLQSWVGFCPDFIRIRPDCEPNRPGDAAFRRYVSCIVEIAKITSSQVVIREVGSADAYAIARNLGVRFALGEFFAPANPLPEPAIDLQKLSGRPRRSHRSNIPRVSQLLKGVVSVHDSTLLQDVEQIFIDDDNLKSVALTNDEGIPLGLVLRSDLLNILVQRYGRELFARKPIRQFIRRSSFIFDQTTSLEEASRSITNTHDHYIDEFIITNRGKVTGKGLLLDLLSAITDMQITRARYANPLTLLPGNVIIQQKLDECIQTAEPFHVAYCDLDNFKAYNDVYGYHRGDEIIRLAGRLLVEICETEQNFVGHIGGDDFIVLFREDDWLARCDRLFVKLAEIVPHYYSEEDRTRGSIMARDRFGQMRDFPLVTLSVGAISVDDDYEQVTLERIAEIASIAKKAAKQTDGNSLHRVAYTAGQPLASSPGL